MEELQTASDLGSGRNKPSPSQRRGSLNRRRPSPQPNNRTKTAIADHQLAVTTSFDKPTLANGTPFLALREANDEAASHTLPSHARLSRMQAEAYSGP